MNVDESISVEIDNILVYRNDKEDILRSVFSHARFCVQTELKNMLQEFCGKKEIGKVTILKRYWESGSIKLILYHLQSLESRQTLVPVLQ